nr:50S ribosomal protein L18 [candidate division Zixibacteria bacterium]
MHRIEKYHRRAKRKARVRAKIFGTTERPRLTITKSLNNVHVQIVDDEKMITLVAASSLGKETAPGLAEKSKTEQAGLVGEMIARKALEKGIKKVAFDRNGNIYHGRVKALAEAARKAGLEF